MEKEIWKAVPNYEGFYETSSLGRVKSLDVAKKGSVRKGKILNPTTNRQGYFRVVLYKYGIQKAYYVHQLVSILFLNHKPNGQNIVVNHIDGDNKNNHISNLEIVTQRENISRCFRKDRDGLTSKYVGVSWYKSRNKWMAQIKNNGVSKYLGIFTNELDAANAYQNELKLINGQKPVAQHTNAY